MPAQRHRRNRHLNFWEREFAQIDVSHVGPGTLAFTNGFQFNRRRRVLKRVADFTVSLLFLAAVLPITLLVAAAIKLESKGPVFYRQERVGLNGRIFRVWKFRSMRTDAELDGVPRWASAKEAASPGSADSSAPPGSTRFRRLLTCWKGI